MERLFGIILIFVSSLVVISVQYSYDIEPKYLFKFDRGCKDVDIRSNSSQFKKLRNCERVHGYLRISYLDFDAEKVKPFSDIKEITGYLLIDHVTNLKNISQLFPNLLLIRGEKLHHSSFSLIIVNNQDLELVDLRVLIISTGSVRIENNKKLSFTELQVST